MKVRQSSSKIPRYFTYSVSGTFCPSNLRLFFDVKNENSVSLLTPILSDSLLASSSFSRDFGFVLVIRNIVSFVLRTMNTLVSSTNNLGVGTSNAFSKRLEKSSGSYGVLADTRDAVWTARSLYSNR